MTEQKLIQTLIRQHLIPSLVKLIVEKYRKGETHRAVPFARKKLHKRRKRTSRRKLRAV